MHTNNLREEMANEKLKAFQDAVEAWLDAYDTVAKAQFDLEAAKSALIEETPALFNDKIAYSSVDGRTVVITAKEFVISVEVIGSIGRFL